MMTNNYRRLHKMPMVHTKRYPHQSRFKKRYGFTLSELVENIHRVVDGVCNAFNVFAERIHEWAKEMQCQKSTF